MIQKLSKKEQLALVARAACLEVVWVGEDQQQAQLPTRDYKDWDPFENSADARELATYMGFFVTVDIRHNRTIVTNGMREVVMSHGRNGEHLERATRHAISRLAAMMGLTLQEVLDGNE